MGWGADGAEPGSPRFLGNEVVLGGAAPRKELDAALPSSLLPPQIPIAVSGVRGMGFLMKYHIETGGGQLPAKLSSLFIKVSGASLACEKAQDQRTL